MTKKYDMKPTRPMRRVLRIGAIYGLALALCPSPVEMAVAQTAVDGCPQSSPPESQTGATLQGYAEDSNAGVIYNDANASLGLARSGGVFQASSLPIGELPVFVCGGDFDGDGWDDFIGAGNFNTFIKLFKNVTYENPEPDWSDNSQVRAPKFSTPYPTLQSGTTSTSSFSAHNGAVACGDFNGDGNMDFAFVTRNSNTPNKPKKARIWLGNGNGTFQAPYKFLHTYNHFRNLSWSHNGEVVDFNGDGHMDIIWGLGTDATHGGQVGVFLNDGDPTEPMFTPNTLLVNGADMGYRGSATIAYNDFTGDGVKDLVASGMSTDKLRLYPGLPGGGVDTVNYQDIPFPIGGATMIMHADFSLNGNTDIVVATDNWHIHGGTTSVNNDSGGYTFFYSHNGTNAPFSAGVTQTLTQHDDSAIYDLDVGLVMDYDHDPDGTPDFIIADGNHTGNYYVFANRPVQEYVQCGEVASGILDLGPLADEEMVITSARIDPSMVIPSGTSVTFYMANDDPPNWELANPCPDDPTELCVAFPSPSGRTLRWKAEMCSDESRSQTPLISGVQIAYDYTPAQEHYRAGVVVHDGVAYVGAFRQPGDRGHFYATNAGLTQTYWDAAEKLDDMSDGNRNVYTATVDGQTRLDFTAANTGDALLQQTLNVATQQQATEVVNWQRRARFGINNNNMSKLGSVENSTPALLTPPALPNWYTLSDASERSKIDQFVTSNSSRDIVALFGAKDGALHAVRSIPTAINDTANGQEAWAFIPAKVAYNLVSDMASGGITSYPDGSPTLADVVLSDGNVHTVAIVAGGSGGRSTFALDVTDSNSPQPMWHIVPGGSNAGQAYSKAAVARVNVNGATKFYAIFGSGHAFDNLTPPYTKGLEIVAVDIDDGTVAWKFQTRCPLTSDIVVFETDDEDEPGDLQIDGFIDRVVFADGCGYVYKLDPAKTGGGWNDNTGLGSIDSGSVMGASTVAWALFSTQATTGAIGGQRPIAGTIGARVDASARMVLFFGTGGIESFDPSLQNEFYGVYADNGTIRSKITGTCTDGVCEKFYGGVVVTSEQVILTRTLDPPIGQQNTCDFGSSDVEGYQLNDNNGEFVEDFSQAISSASISSIYGAAGAVYLTTLAGAIIGVGTPRSTHAGGDTAGGYGGGFTGSGEGSTETTNMSLLGWRQVF